ncbi:sodium:calcium antiporter [Actinocatenispora rupis]|uniref:Membrane protein n=1 Tax=Actinocatenispora rupis TaxID=519421 RepID=A0A8J3J9P2_9ACTN|nr:sodium:calcium antiporter [Actinocatenispora rupis]GID10803.1 membrane protein [Actinocatenispora rupis]
MWHFVALIACAVAIYFSCEWFVNAVEWLGKRLDVGRIAVGTILAAFGTALPESVVTFVAVVFGHDTASKDIGIGAAMGGPLALSTVAYGVTGVMVLLVYRRVRARSARVTAPVGGPVPGDAAPRPTRDNFGDLRKLARDQRWFLVIFVVKVGLGLVAFAVKPWLGLAFFAAYAVYFWREIRAGGGDDGDELDPLLLQRRRPVPATWAVVAQTLGTLAIIFVASQLFVRQLDAIGPMLGLPAAVTALLLSPIATELPEIMNAIIWVRQGKTPLALANISGAMMIQATVPSGLGLLFTPWLFDSALLLSGIVTIAAIVFLLILLRTGRFTARTLALSALFYLVFAIGLVPILS